MIVSHVRSWHVHPHAWSLVPASLYVQNNKNINAQCNGDGTKGCTRPFFSSKHSNAIWAVLINTNGWYGCEELKSRSTKRVRNATNFATGLRSGRSKVQRPFRCEQKAPFFTGDTAFKDLLSLGTPGDLE